MYNFSYSVICLFLTVYLLSKLQNSMLCTAAITFLTSFLSQFQSLRLTTLLKKGAITQAVFQWDLTLPITTALTHFLLTVELNVNWRAQQNVWQEINVQATTVRTKSALFSRQTAQELITPQRYLSSGQSSLE